MSKNRTCDFSTPKGAEAFIEFLEGLLKNMKSGFDPKITRMCFTETVKLPNKRKRKAT